MTEIISGGPKSDDVTIQSIAVNDSATVFGLGSDGLVYVWDQSSHTWNMFNTRSQG